MTNTAGFNPHQGSCAFCDIIIVSPPSREPVVAQGPQDKAHIVLSTPSVVAFLHIAPVSKGHLLVMPRAHGSTIGDVKAEEAAVLGFWLPIISRGVMKGVFGDEHTKHSWNIVQANGDEAGQTVKHTHFHIIPRPTFKTRDPTDLVNAETRNLEVVKGMHEKMDEAHAWTLHADIRAGIRAEVDKLRMTGEIVDGGFCWEYWGNVEARGLKM